MGSSRRPQLFINKKIIALPEKLFIEGYLAASEKTSKVSNFDMIHIGREKKKRHLIIKNGNRCNFVVGSLGVDSYINSMELQVTPGCQDVSFHVGNYCSLGYNIMALLNRNHDYKSISTSINAESKKIKQRGEILIGNDVWIGNNVILLSGNRIGSGAVIGAGAVVSKDIPPYAIAVGNPIRITKYRFSRRQIDKLLKIKWWNWSSKTIEERRAMFSNDVDEFIESFNFEGKPTGSHLKY